MATPRRRDSRRKKNDARRSTPAPARRAAIAASLVFAARASASALRRSFAAATSRAAMTALASTMKGPRTARFTAETHASASAASAPAHRSDSPPAPRTTKACASRPLPGIRSADESLSSAMRPFTDPSQE